MKITNKNPIIINLFKILFIINCPLKSTNPFEALIKEFEEPNKFIHEALAERVNLFGSNKDKENFLNTLMTKETHNEETAYCNYFNIKLEQYQNNNEKDNFKLIFEKVNLKWINIDNLLKKNFEDFKTYSKNVFHNIIFKINNTEIFEQIKDTCIRTDLHTSKEIITGKGINLGDYTDREINANSSTCFLGDDIFKYLKSHFFLLWIAANQAHLKFLLKNSKDNNLKLNEILQRYYLLGNHDCEPLLMRDLKRLKNNIIIEENNITIKEIERINQINRFLMPAETLIINANNNETLFFSHSGLSYPILEPISKNTCTKIKDCNTTIILYDIEKELTDENIENIKDELLKYIDIKKEAFLLKCILLFIENIIHFRKFYYENTIYYFHPSLWCDFFDFEDRLIHNMKPYGGRIGLPNMARIPILKFVRHILQINYSEKLNELNIFKGHEHDELKITEHLPDPNQCCRKKYENTTMNFLPPSFLDNKYILAYYYLRKRIEKREPQFNLQTFTIRKILEEKNIEKYSIENEYVKAIPIIEICTTLFTKYKEQNCKTFLTKYNKNLKKTLSTKNFITLLTKYQKKNCKTFFTKYNKNFITLLTKYQKKNYTTFFTKCKKYNKNLKLKNFLILLFSAIMHLIVINIEKNYIIIQFNFLVFILILCILNNQKSYIRYSPLFILLPTLLSIISILIFKKEIKNLADFFELVNINSFQKNINFTIKSFKKRFSLS